MSAFITLHDMIQAGDFFKGDTTRDLLNIWLNMFFSLYKYTNFSF